MILLWSSSHYAYKEDLRDKKNGGQKKTNIFSKLKKYAFLKKIESNWQLKAKHQFSINVQAHI